MTLANDETEPSAGIASAQPDRLAVIATLFGLSPVPPSQARVLELGCGDGSHVVAMAARYPQARFVGVDTVRLQVEQGNRLIDALGLQNVSIVLGDVQQMQRTDEAASFDYVICPSLYSNGPAPHQDAILRLCREALAPEGVAYIRYDTYPGWKMREVVRDVARFHGRGTKDVAHSLVHARAMLTLLKDVVHVKTGYGRMLVNESAPLAALSDAMLLRECFESDAHPCYFSEFIDRAHAQQLAFLGEAVLGDAAHYQRGRKLSAALEALGGGDWLAAEQYLDFLRNRMMRRTLLVPARTAARIDRGARLELLERLHSSCAYQPVAAGSPYDQEREFKNDAGRSLKTENLGIQAMMHAWADAYPRSLGFAELLEATRHKRFGQHEPPSPGATAEALLRFAKEGVVQLHAEPIRVGKARDARPRAFAPALEAARNGVRVVFNARLEPVMITSQESAVLGMLDGLTDAAHMREAIVSMVERDRFGVSPGEAPATSEHDRDDAATREGALLGDRRAAAASIVRHALRRFERLALLIPEGDPSTGPREAPAIATTVAQ